MKAIKYFILISVLFLGNTSKNKIYLDPRYSPEVEDRIERVINNLQVKTDIDGFYESEAVSERLEFYHTPGVSIAVINDGKVEWARGFGIRNEVTNDSVDINTLFMAGSVSKPIFALAVMRLKEKGIVDLDKDVNEYLKTWKVPAHYDWQPKVTLRQLLSHTAGLTVGGFEGYLRTDPIPTIEQVLNGVPPANSPAVRVNILPGTIMRYSGGGTTVAQLTIMNILGKPFPVIMHEELLGPIKLNYSTYEQPLPESLQSNSSTGFPNKGKPIEGGFHVYPEMGAAGLWSTPGELAALMIEVQKALKGESDIFKKETIEEMLTPQRVYANVGIGFFLQSKGDSARFFHSGWDEGFVTTAVAYQKIGKGAVVMVNSNEGFPMLDEIISAIAIEYKWPDFITSNRDYVNLNSEEIRNYTGKYYDPDNTELKIENINDSLYLIYENQDPVRISKTQSGDLRNPSLNFSISISNDTLKFTQEQSSEIYIKK